MVSKISIRDNFFELGGTSLLAVTLVERVRARLGRTVPVGRLISAPTIESLALSLEKFTSNSGAEIVELKPGTWESPFFLIHPAGGHVLPYKDLIEHLKTNRAVHGIQSGALHDPDGELKTIEAMAEAYASLMRAQQSSGPYLIGGWSMGGVVAFEIARVLEAQGEKVDALFLLDSRIADGEILSAERPPLDKSISLMTRHTDLLLRYRPQGQIQAPIFIWDAQENVHSVRTDWSKLTKSGTTAYHTQGNHFTMLLPPNIQRTAEQLSKHLS